MKGYIHLPFTVLPLLEIYHPEPLSSLQVIMMYVQYTTIAALLSLLSFVQSTSVSVNCAAPWVSTAIKIVDGLPSSEGILYCSTLLSKYKTVTGKKLYYLVACAIRYRQQVPF